LNHLEDSKRIDRAGAGVSARAVVVILALIALVAWFLTTFRI